MSVVVVRAGKGAPGGTTIATALATFWPADRRLLVEADPEGGALAARFSLAVEPGLVSLAAASRGGVSEALLARHSQSLPDGLAVLPAPVLPEQVRAALAMTAAPLATGLAALADAGVVIDVGRAWPADVVAPLVDVADAVILVCRPSVEELQQVGALVDGYRAHVPRVGLVLVGESPYSPAEVGAAVDPASADIVWGVVPEDRRQAEILNGQRGGWNWAGRRLPLVRAAAELAQAVATRLDVSFDAQPSPSGAAHNDASVWRSSEVRQ